LVTSYSRGHEIYFDGYVWRYIDNNQIDCGQRPCKRCGKSPTREGYDACIGYIENASSACCGHGAEQSYIISKA